MTTGNAPTIEEQIDALYKRGWNDSHQEKDYDPRKSIEWQTIRDSLKKLAALEKPVSVEPFRRFRGVLKPVDRGMWVNGPCDYYHDAEVDTRIDYLQSALKLAQEERDAKLEQLQIMETHLNLAESINRRMVEQYRDLVVAAENLNSGISLTRNEDKEKMWKLTVALAKLEES